MLCPEVLPLPASRDCLKGLPISKREYLLFGCYIILFDMRSRVQPYIEEFDRILGARATWRDTYPAGIDQRLSGRGKTLPALTTLRG